MPDGAISLARYNYHDYLTDRFVEAFADNCGEWCEENGIQPSTFYNWVNRLRKKGCEIPSSVYKEEILPLPHQDVVRVDLVPDVPVVDVSSPTASLQETTTTPCLRLEFNGAKLDIPNDVNPELLVSVLRFLRGASC